MRTLIKKQRNHVTDTHHGNDITVVKVKTNSKALFNTNIFHKR